MFRVGLTGNVASGKSSVARVWAEAGASVVDADALARQAVEPGSRGLEAVRTAFGESVMDGDALDRDALRRRVFRNDEARERLESIIHPEVARLREREEARLRERGVDIVVHDVPLLFEVGLEDEFDMVVLVDAPRKTREERLVRERGLSRDEARAMIDAQMPAAVKRGRADMVIDNHGTLESLREKAETVWREIRRRAGAGHNASAGWVRVDMHIHTRSSFDCLSDPEAVLERATEQGLHRICITDHDEIRAAIDLAERYPERIIVGEEVKTAEGVDIIGLYLTEWIPKGTPARETCEQIREQGGLVYVPHPFAGGKGGGGTILPEIEDLVQVVEGFNARIHTPRLNDRAQQWARARNLPLGAGSDAHTLGEIGNGYVEVPAFNNEPRSFLAALQRATLHGTEASRLVHLASTVAKLWP
ncbi:MAG: dephospho-CoA kinase [Longimicrobiales bacterium]